jgi:hypothetical protein
MFKTSQQGANNVGALGGYPAVLTADGTGLTIDRMQQTSGQQGYDSATAILATGASVGSGNYARITVEHSANDSDWVNLDDPQTGTQYVSGTIGSQSVVSIDVDLSAARRYVRFNTDVTIGGTSLACAMVAALCGAKVNPQ